MMKNIENSIGKYLEDFSRTFNLIDVKNVAEFVIPIIGAYESNKNIFVFGNGGSAATASHFYTDLIKGVNQDLDRKLKIYCLNDNVPVMSAISNDFSYDDIFIEQLKPFLQQGDLVIGISCSGNSKNIIKAMEYAKEKGAESIAMCAFDGGRLKNIVDTSIHLDVDSFEISEDIHLILAHSICVSLKTNLNDKK